MKSCIIRHACVTVWGCLGKYSYEKQDEGRGLSWTTGSFKISKDSLYSLGLHQFTKSMVIHCLFITFGSGTDFIQVCSSAEFTVWFTAPGSRGYNTAHNKSLVVTMFTCCDGVDKASISFPTIGFTLRSSRSKCLAREPIRITTDWRTASKLPESGALSRNSSKTDKRLFTVSCNKIGT